MLAVCLLGAFNPTPAAQSEQHQYFYYKRPVPLVLDTSHVMALDSQALRDFASAHELRFDSTTFSNMPRSSTQWVPLSFRAVDNSPTGVHQLLDAAEDSPSPIFITPVFFDPRGFRMFPLDTIILRFMPGVSEARQDAVIASIPGVRAVLADAWGMTGAFRVETSDQSGLLVLRLANALAGLPEVRFAEPSFGTDIELGYVPNEFPSSGLWGLHQPNDIDLNAPGAWEYSAGAAYVRVVVLDNGIQHPLCQGSCRLD
jgi:hypothetical protein